LTILLRRVQSSPSFPYTTLFRSAVACRTPDGAERVQRTSRPITAAPGEVASAPIRLPFPHADRPTPVDVTASLPGLHDNRWRLRSEEHTSELQSREKLVCRLLLE